MVVHLDSLTFEAGELARSNHQVPRYFFLRKYGDDSQHVRSEQLKNPLVEVRMQHSARMQGFLKNE
jgi:hypothetical protein